MARRLATTIATSAARKANTATDPTRGFDAVPKTAADTKRTDRQKTMRGKRGALPFASFAVNRSGLVSAVIKPSGFAIRNCPRRCFSGGWKPRAPRPPGMSS